MTIFAFGDLHLGSVRTDYKGIEEILGKLRTNWPDERKYIFVGDLIDSTNMYSIQKYYHFPESLDVQRALVLWIDKMLDGEKILVCGNHEKNLEGINILEFLKLLGWKIYESYYCEDVDSGYLDYYFNQEKRGEKIRVCFVHASNKTYHGSNIVGRTPGLHFFDYALANNLNANVLVTAHTHKIFNMVIMNGIKFIMLPSFEYDVNSPGKTIVFTPAVWVFFEKENREKIVSVKRTPDDILYMRERNIKFVTEIISKHYSEMKSLIYTSFSQSS